MNLDPIQFKNSSRKGRFKHQLIPKSDLDEILRLFNPLFTPYLHLYRTQKISAAELAASYILIFNWIRRPKDSLGGHVKEATTVASCSKPGLKTLNWISSLGNQNLQEKLKSKNLPPLFIDFFFRYSHRSLPFSVNRAIKLWHEENYKLKLYFNIPSPLEVLELQVKTQRCVTLLHDFKNQEKYNGERDPLAFIVHDLIHADHFFSNSILVTGQTKFLQLVHKNMTRGDFEHLAEDTIFANEFEYLISDMNSHPAHLVMTLISIVERAVERAAEKCSNKSLIETSPHLDSNRFLSFIFSTWNCPSQVLIALMELTKNNPSPKKDLNLALVSSFFNKN